MILSEVSVRRPVFAMVISMLLLLTGIMAAQKLAIREYPDISRPVVNVSVTYRGASATVVESKVTQLLENQLAGVEGITKLTSSSQDERAQINLEFTQDRDLESAANDVRDRVSRVASQLPTEADTPRIAKADSNAGITMFVNVVGEGMSQLELSDYADRNVVDRFSIVPGVAIASVIGERRFAMRVWLNRSALAARRLTVQDVEAALRAENVELPAGRLESQQREFILNTDAGMASESSFRNLVVGRGADGYLVRLGEVAEIKVEAEDFRSIYRATGQNAVGVSITPTSTANVVDISRGIRAEIERMKPNLPPGMDLFVSIDNTVFVSESLSEVEHTIFITLGLVLVVIYGFLGSARATIIPAVTIPISIISACLVMSWFGYSINTLTLLGAVLAVAIVVDDAIVVLENIVRRIEAGEPALLAAVDGSREIGFAVIATTLVLCAVFLPISFMEGNIGRLFSEFGVTIAAGIAFSAIIALSLVPMMSSKLFANGIQHGKVSKVIDAGYQRLSGAYERSLRAATRTPWMIVGIAAATIPLAYALFTSLPSEYAPQEDRSQLIIRVQAPEGASLAYMDRYLQQVEKIVQSEIELGNAERMIARTGGFGGRGNSDVTSGMIFLPLKSWGDRKDAAPVIAQRLRLQLNDIPGVRVNVISPASLGVGGGGRPVQLVLGGGTYEELVKWRDIVLAKAAENPGLQNVDSDYSERSPQIKISVDRDRAADLGISLTTVGRTLETMMGSRRVTTFLMNGEEYNVVLQARESDRATPSDLDNIYVRSTSGGGLIPLSNLVKLEEVAGPLELKRFDRLRSITIQAGLAPGYSLGQALNDLEKMVRTELPPEAQINYDGESREFRLSGGALYTTFLLALVIVFLVLAAQFESFKHASIIISTVPLAVTGALLGLWFQGSSINVFSQIGAVMLIGLAAKNGILIVEFANQLRDRGTEFAESIIGAAIIRLRPVLMTSLCMVFGAMPLLLAAGAGAEARKSLGAVVIYGVVFSMLMTLYVVPSMYLLIARNSKSPQYVTRMIERLRGAKPVAVGEAAAPAAHG
ncbi:MAG: efflux RND transporter permease subunit [Steroidobacteraceae bacterium]